MNSKRCNTSRKAWSLSSCYGDDDVRKDIKRNEKGLNDGLATLSLDSQLTGLEILHASRDIIEIRLI